MITKLSPICVQHNIKKSGGKPYLRIKRMVFLSRYPMCTLGFVQKMVRHHSHLRTADELIVALREFVDAAKRSKERRSVLTEYVVAVE